MKMIPVIGQIHKNKSYEFLLTDAYILVNPSFSENNNTNLGIDFQSFVGARNIYRTSHAYFNSKTKHKMDWGAMVYTDTEEEFSNLISVSTYGMYEIFNNKKTRLVTGIRPNIWNFVLQGNHLIAGVSTFAFNIDVGGTLINEKWTFSTGGNNMVPLEFKPLDQKVIIAREWNSFFKYNITKHFSSYTFWSVSKTRKNYYLGMQYQYLEIAKLSLQWSITNGFSTGAKVFIDLNKQLKTRFGINYGISNGEQRISQYQIEITLLKK